MQDFRLLLAVIYRIKVVNWLIVKGSYDDLMNYQKVYWLLDNFMFSLFFKNQVLIYFCFMPQLKWALCGCAVDGLGCADMQLPVTPKTCHVSIFKYTTNHLCRWSSVQKISMFSLWDKRKMHCLTVQFLLTAVSHF